MREGDAADFIAVKDLKKFEVVKTIINGELVAENGISNIKASKSGIVNNFSCSKKETAHFEIPLTTYNYQLPVIEALDGQLITNRLSLEPTVKDDKLVSDTDRDILKIVVVNRYNDAPVAKAFIKNFGLKHGALASSVAHDSHNIVAVGADDESICVLRNHNGITIDSLSYDHNWHFALLDIEDGVSLERIDYNKPTQDKSNWHSAASTAGFATPTYR